MQCINYINPLPARVQANPFSFGVFPSFGWLPTLKIWNTAHKNLDFSHFSWLIKRSDYSKPFFPLHESKLEPNSGVPFGQGSALLLLSLLGPFIPSHHLQVSVGESKTLKQIEAEE